MKRKQNKFNISILNIVAIIVVAIAIIAIAFKLVNKSASSETVSLAPEVADNKITVDSNTLSEEITFIDYNSNGTDMQIMLLKTEDGKIRCAFNTCQVCNGSPYAYFEQEGDVVICQNCFNQFPLTQIGDEQGGCNPIPLEFTQEGDNIVIDTAVLDSYAADFTNWKKGI